MEAKLKHLEFVQTAINRMASNSFLLKGWTITLAGGLLVLSFKEADRRYLYISLMVIALFWMLDGYYLSLERNFIRLYNHVRQETGATDFSMSISAFSHKWAWLRCTMSRTLLLFYGGLGAVTLVVTHYL